MPHKLQMTLLHQIGIVFNTQTKTKHADNPSVGKSEAYHDLLHRMLTHKNLKSFTKFNSEFRFHSFPDYTTMLLTQ